jgi:pimeloyl-ACP methyl ester carboxylesterase
VLGSFPEISFDHFVDDLEAVVEAAGVDRFALLGVSQGCAVSIAYAVRHLERVSRLVLFGGYAIGWKKRAKTQAEKMLWGRRRGCGTIVAVDKAMESPMKRDDLSRSLVAFDQGNTLVAVLEETAS